MSQQQPSRDGILKKDFDLRKPLSADVMRSVDREQIAEMADVDVDVVDRIIEAYAECVFEE